MSNLVKSRDIICDNSDRKVIDSNALISEKILKIKETIAYEKQMSSKIEIVEGIDAKTTEELLNENPEELLKDADIKAKQIVQRANEDADAIIERAKAEADLIRADSVKIGKEQGYEEGRKQAELELAELKKSVEDERIQMEIEYNERLNEMEPVLAETILNVVSKVTHVLAEDKKDLVLQLVNDVLSKTELSKEFLIRVSPMDYRFLLDNRDRINGVVSHNVQIEIVEDPTFTRGQCMIESDSGIYDCSLDIQLENLISAIKVMSCLVND